MKLFKTAFRLSLLANIMLAAFIVSHLRHERQQFAQIKSAADDMFKNVDALEKRNNELRSMSQKLENNNQLIHNHNLQLTSAMDQLDTLMEEITNDAA